MVAILEQYGVERVIINSACDWGVSDPLAVPKTVALLRERGFGDEAVDRLVWDNPASFFARDDRADAREWLEPPVADRTETFGGNSVLRGQDPAFTGVPGGD
jgi:hypothetical protein